MARRKRTTEGILRVKVIERISLSSYSSTTSTLPWNSRATARCQWTRATGSYPELRTNVSMLVSSSPGESALDYCACESRDRRLSFDRYPRMVSNHLVRLRRPRSRPRARAYVLLGCAADAAVRS